MKPVTRIFEEVGAWMTVGVLIFAAVKLIEIIF